MEVDNGSELGSYDFILRSDLMIKLGRNPSLPLFFDVIGLSRTGNLFVLVSFRQVLVISSWVAHVSLWFPSFLSLPINSEVSREEREALCKLGFLKMFFSRAAQSFKPVIVGSYCDKLWLCDAGGLDITWPFWNALWRGYLFCLHLVFILISTIG